MSGAVVAFPSAQTGAPAPSRPARRLAWPLGLAVPLAAVAAWEVGARAGLLPANLMPAPSAVAETIADLARRGELAGHLGATLARVAAGFGAGVAAATLLGALSGASGTVRRLFDPTLQALRNVPSIAWVPLFILWFGIFETSKVLLIAVGVFFPIYLSLAAGILDVDRKLVEVGRIYRFSRWRMIRRVLLPAVLPTYLIGLRGGLGLGWMFVVAAEFMGASQGLGYLLIDGQQTGKPATIVAAILLFALLGKATDWLLARASARALAWQDSFKTAA